MGLFKGDHPENPEMVDEGDCLCKHRGTPAEQETYKEKCKCEELPEETLPDLKYSEIVGLLAKLSKEVKEIKERLGG